MRAALLLVLAAPAWAQDASPGASRLFQPPPGCTATLTVQEASCTVVHVMACASDPPGSQRRVAMDEGGVSMVSVTDAEWQWLETDQFLAGTREVLAPSPPDPASLSGLLATGVDSYDFSTLSDQVGVTRYVGEDRLTGETVVIDGVTLERTAFRYRALDGAGNGVFSAQGNQFVDRARGGFYGGPFTVTSANGTETLDDSPVEFIEPGEPGFLSASPKHGCGLMLSGLALGGGQG